MVAFTAHLSVTIKRLTIYKHKEVLAAMLEGYVLQRASLRSCPLPINPLCLSREEGTIFFPLEPKKQKKKKIKKNNAWSQVTNMPANTNHTTLSKNQSPIKYLP